MVKKILARALLMLMAMALPSLTAGAVGVPGVDVRGLLFVDSNRNGVLDGGEDRAIYSAKVQLAGLTTRSTYSYDGIYQFDAVLPGRYVITAGLKDGNGGELLLAGQIIAVVPSSVGYNVPMYPAGCQNTVAGTVFIDANKNGEQEPGELGVPNAVIVFASIPPGFAVLAIAGEDGNYSVSLVCGEYEVIATVPGFIGRRNLSVGEVVGGLTNIPMVSLERRWLPLVMSH
ncbi:MAG: carboxypeptidase-like regulatory domain-containing protein [bacterium]